MPKKIIETKQERRARYAENAVLDNNAAITIYIEWRANNYAFTKEHKRWLREHPYIYARVVKIIFKNAAIDNKNKK